MVDTLRNSGNAPFVKELLKMLASGKEMDCEMDFINWFGILFGPTLLLVSSLCIIVSISCGVVGLIKNDLALDF